MAGLRDLRVSARKEIPAKFLSVRFSRSGGPGGQHVNKVESKVDLRLDLLGAEEILGRDAATRIREGLANRLDGEGCLRVVSDGHREQSRNLEAALVRMETLLREALVVTKERKSTRPTRASRERRLNEKRRRGQVKRLRRDRDDD